MKRFIITSLCTLGLSLLGAFGVDFNHSGNQIDSVSNSNIYQKFSTYENSQNSITKNLTPGVDKAVQDILQNNQVSKSKCNTGSQVRLTQVPAKTAEPTVTPTQAPYNKTTPTTKPTAVPTVKPTPTTRPTAVPTAKSTPTTKPTAVPTAKPTATTKPTAVPTDKPSTANTSGISNYANQVLQLVNQERANAGLSALTTNSTLTAAANKRAQETAQSFSHTRPNGTSFSSVLSEYNVTFRAAGENIAYGQRTPQEVVTGWMNSPGHRANILSANFNKIGIGVYQSNGAIYWTQLFTN